MGRMRFDRPTDGETVDLFSAIESTSAGISFRVLSRTVKKKLTSSAAAFERTCSHQFLSNKKTEA